MKSSAIIGIVVAAVVVLGGWYWWSMSKTTTAPGEANSMPADMQGTDMGQETNPAPADSGSAPAAAPAPANTSVVALGLQASAGGASHLVATNGMALYTYDQDTAGVSNCSGGCAANWPPYTVKSASTLTGAAGVGGSVGTITRADGKIQVTYNGMPLYFWVKDTKTTDTTGDGVGGFAVVKP